MLIIVATVGMGQGVSLSTGADSVENLGMAQLIAERLKQLKHKLMHRQRKMNINNRNSLVEYLHNNTRLC